MFWRYDPFGGQPFTSGIYRDTISRLGDCDSTAILSLSVSDHLEVQLEVQLEVSLCTDEFYLFGGISTAGIGQLF